MHESAEGADVNTYAGEETKKSDAVGRGTMAEEGEALASFPVAASAVNEDPLAPRGPLFARARDLGLRTMLGCPYAGMDIDVHKGELTALRGRNGSGKTALLLTLAGRMAHTQGSLEIMGATMPKQRGHVQRHVGLGLIKGVNDLQDNLPVASVVSAEFELYGRRGRRENVAAYLDEWRLAGVARTRVKDLSKESLVRLGIALAMVNNPEAIAVDDVEDQLTRVQSERLVRLLSDIAHNRGIAVMVACTERDLAALADRVYNLS